ncbi:sigma-70 family RNA polymerase sigma factor [Paenibacillaceae bacterium]|nr:sigma-70 family RNA polymerase sigma factor [Paenibacillaceae bacterium]
MQTYGRDVWNLAFLLTKRHDLADDITQDVFLIVYRTIDSFRGASTLKTWLLSITRNTSLNCLKSAFIRKVTLVEWVTSRGISPSAEKKAIELIYTDDIWRAVMKLPIKFREVLILHAKYELTTKEIADVLQLSEGTAKSRLFRARKLITAYWKEAGVYEGV